VLESLPLLHDLMRVSHERKSRNSLNSTESGRKARTFLQCTPSMMKLLLAEGDDALLGASTYCCLVEASSELSVDKIRERYGCRIFNMYGPTETTIWSTMEEIQSGNGPISIGRPIAKYAMLHR